MRIGAILGLAGGEAADSHALRTLGGSPSDRSGIPAWRWSCDILGKSLLDRTLEKLQTAGVTVNTVLRERAALDVLSVSSPAKGAAFLSQWEEAVAQQLSNGIDHLFIVRVGVYSDIDFSELFAFHLQTGAALTQAYAHEHGALDLAIVDASALQNRDSAYRKVLNSLVPQHRRFTYEGYTNRLRSLRDLYRLVQDGLYDRCGLRPAGTQVSEGVWKADSARIDPAATLVGPVFIGSGCEIAAGCTVGAGSAIERDCKIDCGTLVQESCVLQDTYAGVALDIRRAVVSGQTLFHVQRDIGVNIADRRLIRGTKSGFLSGLGSWMRKAAAAD